MESFASVAEQIRHERIRLRDFSGDGIDKNDSVPRRFEHAPVTAFRSDQLSLRTGRSESVALVAHAEPHPNRLLERNQICEERYGQTSSPTARINSSALLFSTTPECSR